MCIFFGDFKFHGPTSWTEWGTGRNTSGAPAGGQINWQASNRPCVHIRSAGSVQGVFQFSRQIAPYVSFEKFGSPHPFADWHAGAVARVIQLGTPVQNLALRSLETSARIHRAPGQASYGCGETPHFEERDRLSRAVLLDTIFKPFCARDAIGSQSGNWRELLPANFSGSRGSASPLETVCRPRPSDPISPPLKKRRNLRILDSLVSSSA
jgi:hypothetical protein